MNNGDSDDNLSLQFSTKLKLIINIGIFKILLNKCLKFSYHPTTFSKVGLPFESYRLMTKEKQTFAPYRFIVTNHE